MPRGGAASRGDRLHAGRNNGKKNAGSPQNNGATAFLIR